MLNERKGRCVGHRAFTLVELLVVIVIVSILGAIVFSVMGRSRGLANQAADVASLRTMHQTVMAYVNDNQGYFPRGAGGSANMIRDMAQGGYFPHTYEYINDPENALRYLPTYLWSTYYQETKPVTSIHWRSSYAFNRYVFGNYSYEGRAGVSFYGRVNIAHTLPINWLLTDTTDIPGRSNFAEEKGRLTQGWNRERNNENLVVTVGGDIRKIKLEDDLAIKRNWLYPETPNVIKND